MSRPTPFSRPHVALLSLLAVAWLAAFPAARGSEQQWTSSWRGEPVKIDGNAEDWHGLLQPVEKQRFAIALQNDAEAIYLCITTRDRVLVTQIVRQGLMVWLDPGEKRNKHVLGVHFPIDSRLALRKDQGGRWPADGGILHDWDQGAVGILGDRKDQPERVIIEQAGGIRARAVQRGEALTYEMKVPFKSSGAPYAVSAEPGQTFRLELETPEWRGPLPPSRGPISFGAAGSAPGGRGVIGYPTVDATYLKKTDVKAVVRLASPK